MPLQSRANNYGLLSLFSLMAAIYALTHFYYSPYTPPDPDYLLLGSAILLLLFPEKSAALALLAAVSIMQFWMLAPLTSNHMMIAFILWLYIAASWIICAVKARSIDVDPEKFYRLFAPPGRVLLLTMYFFGVFHKINSAFLNPDVSCSSAVLDMLFLLPENFRYPDFIYVTAAYGTLIAETLIGVMLIMPRTRYVAVAAGVLFHMLISFSMYRYYVPFTMLSVCLHFLFLDARAFDRLKGGYFAKIMALNSSLTGRFVLAFPVLLVFLIFHFKFNADDLSDVLPVWLPVAALISLSTIIYDRPVKAEPAPAPQKNYFRSQALVFNIFAALFFLSCFSPYIGFKTGQTINMFSNLQTEMGKSNHYIIRTLPYIFDYQNDLVTIIETDDPSLKPLEGEDLAIVGIYFERILLGNPKAYVKYRRGGAVHEIHGLTPEQLKSFRKPLLFTKFMVFNIVNTRDPRSCMDASDVTRTRIKALKIDKNDIFG